MINNCLSGFFAKKALRGFARDEQAVSAIEFALVLPVLVMVYVLSCDVTLAITADRRVTNIASSIGDLVSQSTQISNDEMLDIFEAASSLIAPMPEANLTIVVTSVVADEDGNTTVAWSDAHNGSGATAGSAISVPEGIIAPFESIVVATVTYSYNTAMAQFLSGGAWNFDEVYYLRPRRTNQIARTS